MSAAMNSWETVLSQDIWMKDLDYAELSRKDRVRLSYDRARSLCHQSGVTVADVSHLSNRFFEAHRAAWAARDSAAYVILTIHWNLCIGTIASFRREDLRSLLDDLQNFKLCGEFMLTEVGHGLDARNIETTSTLQADGSFILHTPNQAAAKSMPPTSPWASVPRLAVVMARLIVGGEDRGIKSFIVHLTETDGMCPGITSRLLPFRAGAKPLDHAITSFNQVRLEPHALLGTLAKPKDTRADFLRQIWRVSVGTLAISMGSIPILKDAAYVVWRYSKRRCVSDNGNAGRKVPILSFSTQYRPIVDAVVYASVFEAYAKEAADIFRDGTLDLRVRHGVVSAFKAFVTQTSQSTLNDLIDRCGWQGLYGYNKIIENTFTFRGNSIAEGDVQVLCIRLVAEVLLGRYQLPIARDPTSLLARHESGVWDEARQIAIAIDIKGTGRTAEFDAHILPRCRQLVEATGQRMAYEAAQASKDIPSEMRELFEINCIAADQSWYSMDQTTVSPKELTISQQVHCHHCDADGPVEEKGLKLQQGGDLIASTKSRRSQGLRGGTMWFLAVSADPRRVQLPLRSPPSTLGKILGKAQMQVLAEGRDQGAWRTSELMAAYKCRGVEGDYMAEHWVAGKKGIGYKGFILLWERGCPGELEMLEQIRDKMARFAERSDDKSAWVGADRRVSSTLSVSSRSVFVPLTSDRS
ncbi:hypothetical protein V502_01521 [Pseudogymnoascus sp. VKM F-4520 (FW-2644)]|nr:hypothetical protein V502_01521 [Pseudogymnoascus sp. VKM F-4520 (FW-2644)]